MADKVRFGAVVVDIREEGRFEGRQRFQLQLDQTEFRVGDVGRLEAVGRSGTRLTAEVLRVLEDDAGNLWHVVEKPLGAETAVTATVDRTRDSVA